MVRGDWLGTPWNRDTWRCRHDHGNGRCGYVVAAAAVVVVERSAGIGLVAGEPSGRGGPLCR